MVEMDYAEPMMKLERQLKECYDLLLGNKTSDAAQVAQDLVITARVVAACVEEVHQKEIAPRRRA